MQEVQSESFQMYLSATVYCFLPIKPSYKNLQFIRTDCASIAIWR